jgi:hypothetical protein
MAAMKSALGLVRCGCPTNSAKDEGRSRSAKGAAAFRLDERLARFALRLSGKGSGDSLLACGGEKRGAVLNFEFGAVLADDSEVDMMQPLSKWWLILISSTGREHTGLEIRRKKITVNDASKR